MKVTTEKLPGSQVRLHIEVEPEVMERSLERAYRRVSNRTAIPGFRKGKAPRSLVERYLGRDVLVREALDLLIPEVYSEALESEHIAAVAQPDIELVQAEPPVFTATVPVRPTVELGDYRSLAFPLPAIEVADQELEEALEQVRRSYAPWEPAERPVALGDLVTLEVHSTVEGGQPFYQNQDMNYPVTESFPYPVPGFAAQLVGMEAGVPREFSLILPQDYGDPDLAGKAVAFTVTAREIKGKNLPELNDDFAKGVGDGFESVEGLRAWLRQQIEADKQRDARRELEEQVVQAVVDQTTVEYPEILVEHEIDHLLEDIIPPSMASSQTRLDRYLASIGKSREELREERRPEATRRVLRSLVLAQVAQQEQITVSEEELDSEIAVMAASAASQEQQAQQLFNTPMGRASFARVFRTRKTIARLVDLATGVARPAAEEGAAGAAPAPAAEGTAGALAEGTASGAQEPSSEPTAG